MDVYVDEMYKVFGNNVNALMERENISLQMLAERSQLDKEKLNGYINNELQPPFYTVLRISYALNSNISELFGKIGDPINFNEYSINKYVDNTIKSFRNNLMSIRLNRDYSYEVLAEKVGISSRALEQYDNSNSVPTLRSIFKICKELDLTMYDLFSH